MTRIFQGHSTRQIEGHTGKPAFPDAWYYEPDDYEGDVLWSAPYASRDEALVAAIGVALARLGFGEEFLVTPVTPPAADGTALVALADTQETTVFEAQGLLQALQACSEDATWDAVWHAILPHRSEA